MSSSNEYRLTYRADIEGLRAIAILLVVGAHAAVPGFSGGFIGVDVFFVLSGFLITGLLIQEITEQGSLQFIDFYIRRLRRLLPALLVMLVGSSVLAMLILAPMAQMKQSEIAMSATAWSSNIRFAFDKLDYFAPGTEANIFLHTWSLGVEEQFYLVWPALIYAMTRNARAKAFDSLRVWMLIIAFGSLVACVALTYRQPQWAFYLMPFRAWQFAVGALVWLGFRARSVGLAAICSNTGVRTALGALGLAMLLVAGYLLDANHSYPGLYAAIPTVGAAFVIASGGFEQETLVQRALSLWPVQRVGRISYSWYLWHWPVLLLGQLLTGLNTLPYRLGYVFISLLLAMASYGFIEWPIRRQCWWLTHKRFAIYGSVVAMAMASTWFLYWCDHAFDSSQSAQQKQLTLMRLDAPAIYGMGCDDWYHSDKVKPCVFGDAKAEHVVVLLGDSIAGQWYPALSKLFDRKGWRLWVLTKSACPMVEQSFFYSRIGRIYTECTTWRNAAIAEIERIKPDIVIMSSAASPSFSNEEWMRGSARVMRPLSKAAGQVYVLRATPALPFNGPDCLAAQVLRPQWLPSGHGCRTTIENESSDGIFVALQGAASHFKNVHVLDMNEDICPGGVCYAMRDDKVVFRDSMHLTATFAGSMAEAMGRQLQLDDRAAYQ